MKGNKYIGKDEANEIIYKWLISNGINIRDNKNYEKGFFLETVWFDPSCLLGSFYEELTKDVGDKIKFTEIIGSINISFTINKPETNVYTPYRENIELILSIYENDPDLYKAMGFNLVEGYQWGVKISTASPSIGAIIHDHCQDCKICKLETSPNIVNEDLDPKCEIISNFIPYKQIIHYDKIIARLKYRFMKSKEEIRTSEILSRNEEFDIKLQGYNKSNSPLLISRLIDIVPDVVRSDIFKIFRSLPQTRATWIEELYALFALATNLPPDNQKVYRAFDEGKDYALGKLIANITNYTHNNARHPQQVGDFLKKNNLTEKANDIMDKLSAYESISPGVLLRTPFYTNVFT